MCSERAQRVLDHVDLLETLEVIWTLNAEGHYEYERDYLTMRMTQAWFRRSLRFRRLK